MKNNKKIRHIHSFAGPEWFWVICGLRSSEAVPAVAIDPPEMTHQDLGVVGVPDQHEQRKVLDYLRKHPTNGFEGFQRKHDKRIKRGEIVVRHNPFRSQAKTERKRDGSS